MKILRASLWMHGVILLQQLLHADSVPGYVIGWGNNGGGQATAVPSISFTNGEFVVTGNPFATGAVRIAGQVLSNAIAIAAGSGHSLALRSDGTIAGWGGNFRGIAVGYETPYPSRTNGIVTINGQILSNVVSVVAARSFSLALKTDGTLATWRENYVPAGLTNLVAIAAEWSCSWVLKRDGTVVGWQSDPSLHGYGQLIPVEHLSNVVAIAVGPGGHNTRGVALRRDGTVRHWGGDSIYKDATPPAGLSNVVSVAVGGAHSLALKNDGTIVGWGGNQFGGATGVPTAMDSNFEHLSSGTVRLNGQLLSNVVSIAAGRDYSLALKKDGTVVAWGRMANGQYPATVPEGLSNVVAIAAGAEDFCLAITTNKAVADRFATGRN